MTTNRPAPSPPSVLPPPPRRAAPRRAALLASAAAVALAAAGCADAAGQDDSPDATRAQLSAGPDADGLLGLEVTSIGEVTEVVDTDAFRLDKDGVDAAAPEALAPPEPGEAPAYTDLTQLARDSFVSGDDELGFRPDQEQLLVIVPGADLDLAAGDPVRVVGTVRSLDAEAIEEVYDVEISSDAFAPYLDQLVVVAESVSAVG